MWQDPHPPRPSEITPEALFNARRRVLSGLAGLASGILLPRIAKAANDLTPNTWSEITRYNNYYEFSTAKEVIWKLAEEFHARPWTVSIVGEVQRAKTYDIDDLLKRFPQEERIYRLRCVEGWSAVIPWTGFPLSRLLAEVQPTSRAHYVEFTSVLRPSEMLNQRNGVLPWPYTEGLRIDEAMNPLSLLVTGLYGKPLPNQNGAPLRIAVPWKYGFKSAKALVQIRLVAEQPKTSWSLASPFEYGFYANVNPDVPHPRWSQRREVRLGETAKRPTLLFNGYAEEVSKLYAGMDLQKYF